MKDQFLKFLPIILSVSITQAVYADEVTSTNVTQTTNSVPGQPPVTSTTVSTTKTVTSDEDIKIIAEINQQFAKSTTLTGTDLSVVCKDGVVTLTGIVTTQSQSDEAEGIAKSVTGVKSVVNSIEIKTKTNPISHQLH